MGSFSRRHTESAVKLCVHQFSDPQWEATDRWDALNDVLRLERVDHFVCSRCGMKLMAGDVEPVKTVV